MNLHTLLALASILISAHASIIARGTYHPRDLKNTKHVMYLKSLERVGRKITVEIERLVDYYPHRLVLRANCLTCKYIHINSKTISYDQRLPNNAKLNKDLGYYRLGNGEAFLIYSWTDYKSFDFYISSEIDDKLVSLDDFKVEDGISLPLNVPSIAVDPNERVNFHTDDVSIDSTTSGDDNQLGKLLHDISGKKELPHTLTINEMSEILKYGHANKLENVMKVALRALLLKLCPETHWEIYRVVLPYSNGQVSSKINADLISMALSYIRMYFFENYDAIGTAVLESMRMHLLQGE